MFLRFTAILTPQLYGPCSEFHISLDQLSWIGGSNYKLSLPFTAGIIKIKVQSLAQKLILDCLTENDAHS